MGAWGIKALESDEGLDVIDFLAEHYLKNHTELDLQEMITIMQKEGFFGTSFTEIDFFYDNNALALAELYLEWLDTKQLNYGFVTEDEPDQESVWDKVTSFQASYSALEFLLRYLRDIRDEVPDEDGEREIVELWRDNGENPNYETWSQHLNWLIERLEQRKEHVK